MGRRLDSAADRLCAAAEDVLSCASADVWQMVWDPSEEDPLLETVSWVKRHRAWRATGEHPFFLLREGLEPEAALGDQLLSSLDRTLRRWERDEYGPRLDPALVRETSSAMKEYWQIRQEVGGPGFANAEQWNRPD